MIWTTLLFGGISQMSTHPKRQTKENMVSTLEATRGAWEVEGTAHSHLAGELGEF